MLTEKRNLLTTGQAAKFCSVTPDTILKWIKKGRIDGVRTAGGHYRIEREVLERLIASARRTESTSRQLAECHPESLRCWEYLSERGAVRDNCRQCVVYRVRATRCFLMAGLEPDVGHARQFCQTSCEDCAYYRRVKGLATNVLFITSDDALANRLGDDPGQGVTLRFARNAYEASAIVQGFRPALVVVDVEHIPVQNSDLLDSLTADPRLPGLRIILVVPQGMKVRRRDWLKSDVVVSVLEKPFGTHRLAAVIKNIPVAPLTLEDSPPAGDDATRAAMARTPWLESESDLDGDGLLNMSPQKD